ncbi:aldo/keto reductase [Agromyces atrinae]|uniref:aldo/keto reductase n=1 Tax=Agromyces atrinae TaxID=592376 RepID=UPI001F585F7F|nr:aldo/keto reductase [Agromyces atrinae]MCI2957106.1 aldo/keto reductase [Agromyces atrinae]
MTTPIDPRPLGATGIEVSPLTLGTSGLGQGTEPGSAEEAAAVELATAMLSGPYAVVDTSNMYSEGRSEAVLGLARRTVADPRPIVTKTDRDPESGVFDRDRVWRSFEESTSRLGVDRVGLLHLHDPYTITFEEAMAPGGAVAGMLELKEQGLVDAIGIAAGRVSVVSRYVASGLFDAVLTHNRFTLVDQSARALLEDARERGMGTFNAAPFGGSLLARGSASGGTYAYTPSTPELIAWVERVEALCASHGIDLPTAALHYSLRSPLIDSTVVGISSTARIAQLEERRVAVVPEAFWSDLENLGPAPSTVVD